MIRRSIPILLASLLLVAPSGFAQSTPATDRDLIITDGTADVSGQNDSVIISIAVVTEGASLDLVGSENDAKTRAVLETLKSPGIENLKLKTSGYRVSPQRDYKAHPPGIRGYEVFNAIEATLEGLTPEQLSKQVTKIVGKALDSGANNIQHVQFYIKNRESLENEALKKAVEQAIQRAKTMAAAAGVKLRRIVSLSTQPIQRQPCRRYGYITETNREPALKMFSLFPGLRTARLQFLPTERETSSMASMACLRLLSYPSRRRAFSPGNLHPTFLTKTPAFPPAQTVRQFPSEPLLVTTASNRN